MRSGTCLAVPSLGGVAGEDIRQSSFVGGVWRSDGDVVEGL